VRARCIIMTRLGSSRTPRPRSASTSSSRSTTPRQYDAVPREAHTHTRTHTSHPCDCQPPLAAIPVHTGMPHVRARPFPACHSQWTSWLQPDHDNVQYPVMVAAIKQIAATHGWPIDRVMVWVDYISIPQRNTTSQKAAIASLAAYASCAAAFLIVAPDVKHANTGQLCSLESYCRRMWCRAEQFSHTLRNGTERMWLATDEGDCCPLREDPTFSSQPQYHLVFQGDATDEEDKLSLVAPVLGLYAELLASARMADPAPAASFSTSPTSSPSDRTVGSAPGSRWRGSAAAVNLSRHLSGSSQAVANGLNELNELQLQEATVGRTSAAAMVAARASAAACGAATAAAKASAAASGAAVAAAADVGLPMPPLRSATRRPLSGEALSSSTSMREHARRILSFIEGSKQAVFPAEILVCDTAERRAWKGRFESPSEKKGPRSSFRSSSSLLSSTAEPLHSPRSRAGALVGEGERRVLFGGKIERLEKMLEEDVELCRSLVEQRKLLEQSHKKLEATVHQELNSGRGLLGKPVAVVLPSSVVDDVDQSPAGHQRRWLAAQEMITPEPVVVQRPPSGHPAIRVEATVLSM